MIGDIGLDFVLGPLELWPERGTELIIDRHEMRPGFSAANAALAARHLGASCTLVGDVGDDPLGYWLVGELAGIDVRIAHLPASTTTTVAVLHDDAERSFMTTRGHLELVTWSAMSARIPRAAPGAIALMTGVFLMPQIEHDYPLILADLNARGYRVAVDTGWPPSGWTAELRQAASQWMQHCDILLLNETEVLHLAARRIIWKKRSASSRQCLRPAGSP